MKLDQDKLANLIRKFIIFKYNFMILCLLLKIIWVSEMIIFY